MDDLITTAEVVTGLILSGRKSAVGFDPSWFPEPYNKIISDYLKGKTIEELNVLHGPGNIDPPLHAASRITTIGDIDYISIMKSKYLGDTAGRELEKIGRNMQRGLPIPTEKLRAILENTIANEKARSVRADEISIEDYTPFLPSGSKAIDNHVIGLPNVGVMILGAKTFTGKTTAAIALAANFLTQYLDKEVLFVTLEDMQEGWRDRARHILGDRPAEFWHRFIIQEFAGNVGDILAEASRYPNIGLIILDYIDYLIPDKSFEKYDEAYRTIAIGAKTLAVTHGRSMPIVVLAQFSRTSYKGGVPRPQDIYYTGEAGAWMICLLYNPSKDWNSDEVKKDKNGDGGNPYTLPVNDGKAYLVFWKVKAGFRNHPNDFPGAVQVNWTGKHGYNLDDDGMWFSLSK